jgi:pimeloyl-ACP methyl ester carboxylesterase
MLRRLAPAAALLLFSACAAEPARLLADIEAGARATPAVLEEAARLRRPHPVAGTQADLYHPPAEVRGRLVVVPGLAEAGRRDPRLVAFAASLARAGFLVLVPDLPAAARGSADAADAETVAEALLALPETRGPTGLVGISYAAGPAWLAAMQPRLAGRVDFVLTLGAYRDPEAMVTFLATGAYRAPEDAGWRQGQPRAQALWQFLAANADALPRPEDAASLRAIAAARLARQAAPPPASPAVAAVVALAEERDPEAVPARLAALPAALRARIAALSLAPLPLEHFRGCALLLHGTRDPVIPWTESLRLYRALSPGHARLHLIEGLDHVDAGGLGLGGRLAALEAAREVLALRDGGESVRRGPSPHPVEDPRPLVGIRAALHLLEGHGGAALQALEPGQQPLLHLRPHSGVAGVGAEVEEFLGVVGQIE